jgi:hypothetical protein
MLASAAMMVLAIYVKPSVAPDTSLNPSMTIHEVEGVERSTAEKSTPEQQREGDGTVYDKNTSAPPSTGLYPDPEAGDRVVIPRE